MAIASGGGHRFWRPPSDIWSPKKSPLLQIGIQKMAPERNDLWLQVFLKLAHSRAKQTIYFGTHLARPAIGSW